MVSCHDVINEYEIPTALFCDGDSALEVISPVYIIEEDREILTQLIETFIEIYKQTESIEDKIILTELVNESYYNERITEEEFNEIKELIKEITE